MTCGELLLDSLDAMYSWDSATCGYVVEDHRLDEPCTPTWACPSQS